VDILPAILLYSTILAIYCTKVDRSAYYMANHDNNLPPETDFVGAEPHLLAAGTRDSARLLAQVYFDWAKASNSLESHAGTFALRAVLPYAVHSPTPLSRFISLFVGTYSMLTFLPHAHSLAPLSPTFLPLEGRPFLSATPATR
jgi:hypothetical protein